MKSLKLTVRQIAEKAIQVGCSNQQAAELCRQLVPGSRTTAACAAYYRWQQKKAA